MLFEDWNKTPDILKGIFDFLPYPFLISKVENGIRRHVFINTQFTKELGYSLEDLPTIDHWFALAYPDRTYRDQVMEEWEWRVERLRRGETEKLSMQVKIQTKANGQQWYEITSNFLEDMHLVAFINIHENKMQEARLETENRNRDIMLSVLSHDLRGPISNLVSITKLYERDQLSADMLKKVMDLVHRDVSNSLELLETLLTWTRSNFDKLNLVSQRFMLAPAITSVVELVRAGILNKEINIVLEVPEIELENDPQILSIVLRNVISNAVKFTPSKGDVVIRVEQFTEQTMITVTNSGEPMSEEFIEFVTMDRAFARVGNQSEKGFGLGLRLCREFLPLINGTMEIVSVQSGTSVRVRLQKKRQS